MKWIVLALALAGCTDNSNSAATGPVGLSHDGGGAYIGASAGSSIGGGPLGAGTDDNRAGAR